METPAQARIPAHGKRLADERVRVALHLKPGAQILWFDVAVAFAHFPVAEITVAQRLAEQLHHPLLRLAFFLAYIVHIIFGSPFFP